MARKKKDPIPAGMGWSSTALSMAQLLERDKYQWSALSDQDIINAHARFMFAEEVAGYQAWAKHAPGGDVRMYGPLVNYVSPWSKEGQALTYGDVQGQAQAGSLGQSATRIYPNDLFPGQPNTSMFPQPSNNGQAVAKPEDQKQASANPDTVLADPNATQRQKDDAWATKNLANGAKDPFDNPSAFPSTTTDTAGDVPSAVAGFISGTLGAAGEWVQNRVEGATRGLVVGASTPYDLGQAALRSGAAQKQAADEISGKYGLSEAEKQYILGSYQAQGVYNQADEERKKILDQAKEEFTATPASQNSGFDTAMDSTLLGQAKKDPGLLYGSGPEATGFLPSPILNERADANSAKVLDIMTQEERVRIAKQIQKDVLATEGFMPSLDQAVAAVRPIGWTPGRALAHQWYDVDTTAFNTVSGLVDMSANLAYDPVGYIPGGKGTGIATKVARGIEGTTAHALTLGKSIVVESRTGTIFGAKGQAGIKFTNEGVRESARGKAAVDTLRATLGEDPVFKADAQSAHLVDPATGLVRGPKTRTVVSENAWNWLNGRTGSRVVHTLSGITSPTEIMLRSNRKIDPELALALADASTPAQVRAILGSRMGIDITKPSEFGSITRIARPSIFGAGPMVDSRFRQVFRVAPRANAHIDLNNTEDSVYQLEAWARGIGMKIDDVAPHLDNVIRAHDDLDRYTAIYGRPADPAAGTDAVLGLIGAATRHLVGDTVGKSAEEVALRERIARTLTSAFEGGINPEHRNWANANLGAGTFGTVGADGDAGKVLLEHENLSRTAILPNYRVIKRYQNVIEKYTGLWKAEPQSGRAKWDMALRDALEGITTEWRNVTLVRPAFTLREMIDLSVSMSLAGYASPLTHPLVFASHALSAAIAKDSASRAGAVVRNIGTGGAPGRGLVNALRDYISHREGLSSLAPYFLTEEARVNGDKMWESWNKFIASGEDDFSHYDEMFDGLAGYHGNFNIDQGRGRGVMRYLEPVRKDNVSVRDQYAQAIAQRIAHLAKDRDMRNLSGRTVDDGAGGVRPMTPAEILDAFRTQTRARKMKQRPDLLSDADPNLDVAYLQGYNQILQKVTNDDPVLREAIGSGEFNGKPLLKTKGVSDWRRANDDLVAHIKTLLEDDAFRVQMPDQMYVPKGAVDGDNKFLHWWDKITDEFFAMTGDISDMMVRSPLMREAYVRRVEEIGPAMSRATKAEIVSNLRAAGDYKLARRVMAIRAEGTLGVDEVARSAERFARRESQRIFYDATKRQNYAYAGRVLMPFLQATTNTFRRWGQMSLENPQLAYRTIKPLYYAEQPGSAVLYDLIAQATGNDAVDAYYTPARPDQSVNGFFYEDEYGDRKFAYPMLTPIAAALGLGLPGGGADALQNGISLSGTMGGLNVAGQTINPGVGPVVTLASSMLLDDLMSAHNGTGAAMRWVFPYSLPEGSLPEKVWGSLLPTAYQKVSAATQDDTLVANMAMKVMPALVDTGRYDLSTEAGKRMLVSDSQALATRLYLITAVGGLVTPTQMSPAVVAQVGPENARHLMLVSEISKEFRRYQDQTPDYFAAVDAFVQDYGETALFAVMPRSDSDAPQATNDVWTFRDQHPDTYKQHRTVLGYFFAAGDGTFNDPTNPRSYSPELARAQRKDGERRYKDPEAFVDDVQSQMGWMLWNQKTREIAKRFGGNTDAIAAARRQVRADITAKYPHWTGQASDPGHFATALRDLREAVDDPTISGLTSAKYIGAYIDARDEALKRLSRQGIQSLTSQEALRTGVPQQLEKVAYQMIDADTTGAFARTWNVLLSKELEA